MKFVSPYYLAEKLEIDHTQIGGAELRSLQAKVSSQYDTIFEYAGHKIDKNDSVDFLDFIAVDSRLFYCYCIHAMPVLEKLLHEQSYSSTDELVIAQELKFSGRYEEFVGFVEPFLLDALPKISEELVAAGKFDSYRNLLKIWDQIIPARQTEKQSSMKNEAMNISQLAAALSVSTEPGEPEKLELINNPEFITLLNHWPFQDERRTVIVESLIKLAKDISHLSDRKLAKATLTSLVKTEGIPEELNKLPDAIKPVNPAQIKSFYQSKRDAEEKRNKSIAKKIFIGLGVIILLILFYRTVRVNTIDGYNDYVRDDEVGMSDYEMEQLMGDLLDEIEEENEPVSPFSLTRSWDEQLREIKKYVDEEVNEMVLHEDVSILSDFADPSDRSISNPFIEFFIPLHNKEGYDHFELKNRTDYAVIILVKGDADCFSYFLPSRTTAVEPFSLYAGDELVFYFGKHYENTPDLLTNDTYGFQYVDEVSQDYIWTNYVIGDFDEDLPIYALDPDEEIEGEEYSIDISSTSNPNIEIKCDREIRVYPH